MACQAREAGMRTAKASVRTLQAAIHSHVPKLCDCSPEIVKSLSKLNLAASEAWVVRVLRTS